MTGTAWFGDVTVVEGSVHHAVHADDAGNAYVLLANPDPVAPASVRVSVPKRAMLRLRSRGEERPLEPPDSAGECALTVSPLGTATLIVAP